MKNIFLIFLLSIILSSCFRDNEPYNSKTEINKFLLAKTDLNIDTANFTVLLDSIHNTEGALDTDFDWNVKIKFQDPYSEQLKHRIESTPYYDFLKHLYNNKEWKNVDASKIKGIWVRDSSTLRFIEKPADFSPEPIYITIDTLTGICDITLIHL
jgi:hypothetical protein